MPYEEEFSLREEEENEDRNEVSLLDEAYNDEWGFPHHLIPPLQPPTNSLLPTLPTSGQVLPTLPTNELPIPFSQPTPRQYKPINNRYVPTTRRQPPRSGIYRLTPPSNNNQYPLIPSWIRSRPGPGFSVSPADNPKSNFPAFRDWEPGTGFQFNLIIPF